MKLMVNYIIEEEKRIALIKNKRIRTKEDLIKVKKMIEQKIGREGVEIINWKIIGTNEEKMKS